jgi:hypothetical protein
MLISFVAGALGAPLGELGIDLDGDGIADQFVSVDGVDFDPELNGDLVEVEGYHRADGTWVEPHFRTAPDSSLTNNLSWWDLVNA